MITRICLIFYQFLPTSFVGNEWGQQMRIQIWILRFKELNPLLRLRSEAILHEPNQIRI